MLGRTEYKKCHISRRRRFPDFEEYHRSSWLAGVLLQVV